MAAFIALLLLGLLVGLVHKRVGAWATAIVGLFLVLGGVNGGDLAVVLANLLATAGAAGLLFRRAHREQVLKQELDALSRPKP